MEGKRFKIVVLLMLLISTNIAASEKADIYHAFINGNMTYWRSVINRMDTVKIKSNDYLLCLVNYQYGYIAWCLGNKKNDEAKKYLDLAEKNLLILSKDQKNHSLVNAYNAAFYGYKIGLNRLTAPFFGLKSIDCANEAMKLDKENPLGYVQYGNIQFYMPSVFGGSKKEALKYYLKALELMEKNPVDVKENWNYLSLQIVIAQSYSYLDDFKSSFAYLDRILKIEPDFGYVKNELYLQVLKKMNSKK
jgi:tetratricopeptide (TPR) repeat protein